MFSLALHGVQVFFLCANSIGCSPLGLQQVSYGKVDSLPSVDPTTKARKLRKTRKNKEKNSRKKAGNVH